MKILHVELGRHLYGGARQVLYLLDGLARRSVRQVLVCARGSAIEAAAVARGLDVRADPFRGDHDLAFLARLRRILRTERPDLLHMHSRRGDFLVGLAGHLAGVPMVLSRRVDNPPKWGDLHLKFPWFRRLIVISAGIGSVLIDAGVDPARIVCVPSAVDHHRYRPDCVRPSFRTEFGLTETHVVAAMIAQLIPRKGHELVFEVLPEVARRHPEFRLLIFGRGPLEPTLQRWVIRRGLDRIVHFAGFRDDLETVIPCLDLVIHPAWMEGLGVSLLETAACAVPIVATRVGGIPEAVVEGVNGLLIEPGDRSGLENAMLALLADPERRRRYGAAGRQRVLDRFTVDRMVEGNWRVYQGLMSG